MAFDKQATPAAFLSENHRSMYLPASGRPSDRLSRAGILRSSAGGRIRPQNAGWPLEENTSSLVCQSDSASSAPSSSSAFFSAFLASLSAFFEAFLRSRSNRSNLFMLSILLLELLPLLGIGRSSLPGVIPADLAQNPTIIRTNEGKRQDVTKLKRDGYHQQ